MQANILADAIADRVLVDGPTDLTILCRDGRRFNIHKFIVCAQSQVLAKMCESGMREDRTRVIEHNEFDSGTVALMLEHAYVGNNEVTKRPVPLSILERESQLEDMEQKAREVQKEEAEKKKGVKSGGSAAIDATAATAPAAADADSDGGTASISDSLNTLSLSSQNAASSQSGEPVRKQQQSSSRSTYVFSPSIPLHSLGIVDQLITHARVYGLADYYEIEKLRAYSCNSFGQIVDRRVDLRPDLRRFIEVVEEVGARTDKSDDPLRNCFLKLIMEHATDLCTNRGFIKELGDSGHCGLAADMLREVSESLVRDRYLFIDRRKAVMTLHRSMTEKEKFWHDCAPGWR